MSEAAKKEIEVRGKMLLQAFNEGDVDKALDIYAEDACFMHHNIPTIDGKSSIKQIFLKMVGDVKNLSVQDMFHFELLNDSTALTNGVVASADESGEIKVLFRDTLIWKKIGDAWFISRGMFNEVPK